MIHPLFFQNYSMDIFINGAQAISPQDTFKAESFPEKVSGYSSRMTIIKPDYKAYFNPLAMRRMSNIIKMSTIAAFECLMEAKAESPEGIITATGQGCVEDTEKFLIKMLDTDEGFLNPTTFIQSTHNSLGAQIAYQKKCFGPNIAHVHKSVSFEMALIDSLMMLKDKEADNILVGGVDEITVESYRMKSNINLWKEETYSNLSLIHSDTPGTIPGEGATYLMLGLKKHSSCYARITSVNILYKPKDNHHLKEFFDHTIANAGINKTDIGLVLLGANGDSRYDAPYDEIQHSYFNENTVGFFKHLCGEYETSVAFATWLAAFMLKKQEIPGYISQEAKKPGKINHIAIYNQDRGRNHSLIILSAC